MRHDPPRIVWSGTLWRDVRPMADLYREETPVIRAVLFLLGLALMAVALLIEIVRQGEMTFPWRSWLFDAGLLLALGASHWPL